MRLAFEVQAAFPHLLLVIVSFVIAEFLQGCAAYAQAMYPIDMAVVPPDDPRQQERSPRHHDDAAAPATAARLVLVVTNARRDALFDKSSRRPA